MNTASSTSHQATIVEQFSQQAIPFAQVPGHLDAIQHLITLARISDADTVLDVACGPGLVACECARQARRVPGIDITGAMIEQARKRQTGSGLENLEWAIGDVQTLPYADSSFSRVITRYSFHHFQKPSAVLSEMIRVCQPGGTVLVADVAIEAAQSAAYDQLEIMRDPSHTHALTIEEFSALFARSGLVDCGQSSYGVEIELEAQLRASFPKPGDKERLREMITSDIGINRFGINARRSGESVVYTVPIRIFTGVKR
jgi:ubiquinone/menaquinone biosynthesis C-methylase UbiE